VFGKPVALQASGFFFIYFPAKKRLYLLKGNLDINASFFSGFCAGNLQACVCRFWQKRETRQTIKTVFAQNSFSFFFSGFFPLLYYYVMLVYRIFSSIARIYMILHRQRFLLKS
jgi:hypothetical protein